MKKPIVPRTPAARQPLLQQLRMRKMAESAHAYVRGNTLQFYEWLESADISRIPAGPDIWICGDCHIGNLGPLADGDGNIDIQIRDLDQTVIGNPAHDLIRLALSLAMSARSSDLPGIMTARMLEAVMRGYQHGLTRRKQKHSESIHMTLKQATGRTWRHLAKERLQNLKPEIPLGKRFWPLSKTEHTQIDQLFKAEEIRNLLTQLKHRDATENITILDAAYWVKGCSSLGRLRYAVLVGFGIDQQDFRRGELCLVDIKQAVTAAAPRSATAAMPRDNAQRVVCGARQLAPYLGDRMLAARLLDSAVVVRELLPQDLKFDISRVSSEEAVAVAEHLASVVGRAHWRQMDASTRHTWKAELSRARTKTLDAPSWLWSSVVELVSRHEAAYLEHCRKYSLGLES